jgi:hypothetical protein
MDPNHNCPKNQTVKLRFEAGRPRREVECCEECRDDLLETADMVRRRNGAAEAKRLERERKEMLEELG